ncbi:MAG TPA: hypothetical protein VHV10_06565 [Ktedonobacteraceae bacterium]|nr:hypothetical protein [Ktedonobacteraceae bacterium]
MNNLTLHSALLQIQELNVPIRLTARSVALWSPNTRVPGTLRSIVREHAPEIRDMIQASRIEVCPSPRWHRQEWYFPGEDWTIDTATCAVCERLVAIGEAPASRSNFDKIKVPAMRGSIA